MMTKMIFPKLLQIKLEPGIKTDPRFTIKTGRSLKICSIDSVDGPPTNAHLL